MAGHKVLSQSVSGAGSVTMTVNLLTPRSLIPLAVSLL